MNWLAWDTRSYGGALLGALLGLGLCVLLAVNGPFQPWILGVGMGLGCAVLTKERSTLRGLVLACAAAWAGAFAQVLLAPGSNDGGVLVALAGFHETLDLSGFGLHAVGILGAFYFGRMAFRTDAQERLAGVGRDAAL